jgi:hypothetical protein
MKSFQWIFAIAALSIITPVSASNPIPVPSDPKARYSLISKKTMRNGNLEVISEREGPSGKSFSRREIDCNKMQFRYLGDGRTLQAASASSKSLDPMGPLSDRSISWYVARFVCK